MKVGDVVGVMKVGDVVGGKSNEMCTFCEKLFTYNEGMKRHIEIKHSIHEGGEKTEENIVIVCELCDKVFPNRVQKSNNKLLVHTVREEEIKCDFCSDVCIGLKEICRHISYKHGELFPKKHDNLDECNICYTKFESKDQMNSHKNEKHSPDSFYEKLVEDISGHCQVCNKSFIPSEMEEHFKNVHKVDNGQGDIEVKDLIEDVLNNVIDLSDSDSDLEGEGQTESEDDENNIFYEYSVEEVSLTETYKGKKTLFIQSFKSLKTLFSEKGDIKGKIINQHTMVVKDARK